MTLKMATATATRIVGELEIEEPQARILVVDDHVESLQAMAASLATLGEVVLTANSAEAALRILLKQDISVVVLDVIMPGMDGFQLASLIRERERSRDVPIIFLTGLHDENGSKLQGYRSGAADYITKPCEPEVLRSKVRVFVELAKKTVLSRRYAELVERKNQELRANALALREALERSLRTNAALEREIADRQRAEATRDRLAGQLGARPDFVEAMAEGAVTLALDKSILYCNHRFAALLGRRPEDLAGAPIERFMPPAVAEAFASLFQQGLQGSVKAELDFVGAPGELIPVQVALNRFDAPDLQAVAMVVTDLRDHRRNEEVLAQGRLARLILEYSTAGIAVCDPAGRVTLSSAGLAEISGCNPIFKPFDELFELTVGEELISITEVLRGRIYKNQEVSLRRADGRRFTLLLSAGPISAPDGSQGCVVILVDISEWKQVEETLRRSEKLAAAGRIAGTLAHEVNNPLTSVTNLLYLLEMNQSLDAEARRHLASASAELARVSHIVRNALGFYRESSVPVSLQLDSLLDNVLDLFSATLAAKKLTVNRDYRYNEPVFGYPGETRQIISNLVSNAMDASPEGGSILVRLRSGRDWRTGAAGVRILIADNGPGIARDHYPRLFEPFFTTKGEKGTGLGLWVTQGIVHKHGGRIEVRSSRGGNRRGTVFSVFLPLSSQPMDAAGLDGPSPETPSSGLDHTRQAA